MSQERKAELYKQLKARGVTPEKHYREYTEVELEEALALLEAADDLAAPPVAPPEDKPGEDAEPKFGDVMSALHDEGVAGSPEPQASTPGVPVRPRDPNEFAGQHQNSKPADQPLRVDPETGFIWFQEEVNKPAIPTPRARRLLTYEDPGVTTRTISQGQKGEFSESFEVAGDRRGRKMEARITMPSYQVGIYIDPRFKHFKIHTYQGNNGFDLHDVHDFFGGAELVPEDIKRIYVENDLCYDIRSVVRSISSEFRRLQLMGKVTP